MLLTGFCEYRGKEKKVSSKGNPYVVAHMEDGNGESFNCMVADNVDLYHAKGTQLECEFDLYMGKSFTRLTLVSSKEV